jgi:hypothetical protein
MEDEPWHASREFERVFERACSAVPREAPGAFDTRERRICAAAQRISLLVPSATLIHWLVSHPNSSA